MLNNSKTRDLTCIICPRGCQLTVDIGEGADDIKVCGNLCPRGMTYAVNECTDPQRTVTTTVRSSDGGVVAVKTEGTIPKDKMMKCMKIINSITVSLPVHVGDVICDNVFGTRIVATQNKK